LPQLRRRSPPQGRACPECGADEAYRLVGGGGRDGLDLPDENFDYDDFVKREFGEQEPGASRESHWFWWVVALALAVALGYLLFMRRVSMLLLGCLLAGCTRPAPAPRASTHEADAAFARLADEYIAGYLAWRPQTGTSLGFHEYDGKVTDYSHASLAPS
jgi:hypothetical protein